MEPFFVFTFYFLTFCSLFVGRATLVVAHARCSLVFVDLTIFLGVNRLANAGVRDFFALMSRSCAFDGKVYANAVIANWTQ